MKEYVLTLFLAITTGITLFIFTLIHTHQDVPVFDSGDILFEHETVHGNILVTTDAYGDFYLSFLNRGIRGTSYAGSTHATIHQDEFSLMTLPANNDIPFTTHAVVSLSPNLHEVIVTESGSRIAHQARAKKTTCDLTAVFLVSSVDLTGSSGLIVGLDAAGTIIVEIEIP